MKRLLTISLLLLLSASLFAQSERTTDFGGIVSAEAEAALGGPFGLSVEEELRFDHDFTQFDRWLNSVGVDYTCLHNRMNIGLTADYIRRHNDRGYYENRGRLGLQVTYTEEWRRFKFQVRSKAIGTFLDERTGEHRVNPRLYWRNRLKVVYQQPNSRFKYALSTELFWLTNDPKKGGLDNLRTVLSVDYRLARQYSLSLFARMDNDLQVNAPVDRFYLGMTFKAKF
ncbi:MAG: DUF2490 domain-containing protein [Bacteroidales bacterium]|nr:DUF2490 domain-containing protein [Bacteroidales bacterium]